MKGRKLFCLTALSACMLSSYSANADFDSTAVQSLTAWLHKGDISRLELRLNSKVKENPQLPINGKATVFQDDGQNGDIRAGDGIYSALVPFNLGQVLADQVAGSESAADSLKAVLSFPLFKNRSVIEDKEQISSLESTLRDERLLKVANTLTTMQGSLGKVSNAELVAKLGVDAKTTPLLEVRPRFQMDTIVNALGVSLSAFSSISAASIDPSSSLMITDPQVVDDPKRTFDVCTGKGNPGGTWTFANLIKQLAQGTSFTPEDYALIWLKNWLQTYNLNTFDVPARPNMELFIKFWNQASLEGSGQEFDINYFPARLLAITNRPDLGGNGGYGGDEKRGEARFTFALLGNTEKLGGYDKERGCAAMPFNVIFEYNTPTQDCPSVQVWQAKWKALDDFVLGSPEYNEKLEAITTAFTDFGSNPAQEPNQSLLSQLRTNENALDPLWELREFVLLNKADGVVSVDGSLLPDTVKNTPDVSFDNTSFLANFVNTAWSVSGSPDEGTVPLAYLGVPFRGAASPVSITHWNYPTSAADPSIRQKFSLNTCNACHTAETDTKFVHIEARLPGSESALSRFLTGKNVVTTLNDPANPYISTALFSVSDPAGSSLISEFNDLAARQAAMASILSTSCKLVDTVSASLLPPKAANFKMSH